MPELGSSSVVMVTVGDRPARDPDATCEGCGVRSRSDPSWPSTASRSTAPANDCCSRTPAFGQRYILCDYLIMSRIHKSARIMGIAVGIAVGCGVVSCSTHRSGHDQRAPGPTYSSKRMPDGKEWMRENLNVNTDRSFCYGDSELNCRRYGRLYTWASAREGCRSLGAGWRLPTNDDWRQMAKHYGGVRDDSDDGGKAAYKALDAVAQMTPRGLVRRIASIVTERHGDALTYRFSGTIEQDAMSGSLNLGEYRSATWTARRHVYGGAATE
jgi:uncharacterized protein (TIGR02145 family)